MGRSNCKHTCLFIYLIGFNDPYVGFQSALTFHYWHHYRTKFLPFGHSSPLCLCPLISGLKTCLAGYRFHTDKVKSLIVVSMAATRVILVLLYPSWMLYYLISETTNQVVRRVSNPLREKTISMKAKVRYSKIINIRPKIFFFFFFFFCITFLPDVLKKILSK